MRKLFMASGVIFTMLVGTSVQSVAQEICGWVNNRNGTLRIVNSPDECNLKKERAISWNQIGPEGPQGPPGEPGLPGEDGLACWDLDANGTCDPTTEDTNDDGVCNVLDCQGAPGIGAIQVYDSGSPPQYLGILANMGISGDPDEPLTIYIPLLGKFIRIKINGEPYIRCHPMGQSPISYLCDYYIIPFRDSWYVRNTAAAASTGPWLSRWGEPGYCESENADYLLKPAIEVQPYTTITVPLQFKTEWKSIVTMKWKQCSLMMVLSLVVACAPRPNEWKQVVNIQSTAREFCVGRLAILPFRCSNPEVGAMVADSVASNLLGANLTIVERGYLAEILREQGLTLTGLTEMTDYRRIGRLMDVDFLLVGTLGLLEGVAYRGFGKFSSLRSYSYVSNASARIVRIDTGRVVVSCVYRIPSGAGSDYWTDPTVVGKTVADALKEALEKKQP